MVVLPVSGCCCRLSAGWGADCCGMFGIGGVGGLLLLRRRYGINILAKPNRNGITDSAARKSTPSRAKKRISPNPTMASVTPWRISCSLAYWNADIILPFGAGVGCPSGAAYLGIPVLPE